jgi:large-conductance mechanosensitive channel
MDMKGFIHFIRTQGIVGLAIGFIIGILLGKAGDITKLTLDIHGVVFKWGDFLSNLINLIIIALVIYFIFHALRLDRLDVKKDEKK